MQTDIPKIKRNIERMIQQGAPETDIDAYIAGEGVTVEQLKSHTSTAASQANKQPSDEPGWIDTAADTVKSFGSGVVRGVASLAGLPSDVTKGLAAGVQSLEARGHERPKIPWLADKPQRYLGSSEIMNAIDRTTGVPVTAYEPTTTPGKYARTVGEFVPNMIAPGGMAQRVVGGVVAPALASEAAGQATAGTPMEPVARIAAALAGGVAGSGAVSALNASGSRIPGYSAGASRVLERNVLPGAEARAAQLGPEGFLFETSEPARGIAQGLAIKPGSPAMEKIVTALKDRNAGANARLQGDLDATLGPAVSPLRIEQSLEDQRAQLQPLYEAVAGLNNPVNLRPLYDQLRGAIPGESGATQSALRRVLDMVAPQRGADRIPRSSPREVLNVRQALDDELARLAETPKAHRAVTEYRRLVDEALADAVPDIKLLDQTYANLMRESEALRSGSTVLRAGVEATRPEDLIAQRAAMPLPQREAMRHGVRAELDRVVGTQANDVTALKKTVMADGDWNRVKLAEIFGGREADRILRSIDREAAFQDSYRRLVENSQTAQRQAGARYVAEQLPESPSLRDMTLFGAMASGARKGFDAVRRPWTAARRLAEDVQLGNALTTTGNERDLLIAAIRNAQGQRRAGQTETREMLVRALMNLQAARN